MGHALVIGEALVDVVVRPDGSTDRHPGGSPANVAVGLGRLGRDVELLTWIGEDADGTVVRDHLAGSGVRLVAGSGGAPHTSVATAYLNEAARRAGDQDGSAGVLGPVGSGSAPLTSVTAGTPPTVEASCGDALGLGAGSGGAPRTLAGLSGGGAGSRAAVQGCVGAHVPQTGAGTGTDQPTGSARYTFDLVWDLPSGATTRPGPLVVHTGSIAATLAPGADAVAHELDRHRATSTVTYDPNLRPDIVGPVGAVRGTVERLVAGCDVVKVSDEDLAWLLPGDDPVVVATCWASAGPALVVVTLGEAGALAVTSAGAVVRVDAPRVTVADTVGAGDAFMAGLIDTLWAADLLGADRRADLHALAPATLEHVLARCTQIAAITVSRPGADPPTAAELAKASTSPLLPGAPSRRDAT